MEQQSSEQITACASVFQGDDLRKFWELEERVAHQPALSTEEKTVQEHFDTAHTKDKSGTFIVPLPRKENVEP